VQVKDLIAGQSVITGEPNEMLSSIADKMRSHDVSGIPIVDGDGAMVGIVTAAGLLRLTHPEKSEELPLDPGWSPAQHAELHGPTWRDMPASDVMVRDACTVEETCSVREAARAIVEHGVHRALVVDERKRVPGVISSLDVARLVAEDRDLDA